MKKFILLAFCVFILLGMYSCSNNEGELPIEKINICVLLDNSKLIDYTIYKRKNNNYFLYLHREITDEEVINGDDYKIYSSIIDDVYHKYGKIEFLNIFPDKKNAIIGTKFLTKYLGSQKDITDNYPYDFNCVFYNDTFYASYRKYNYIPH
jgi:hypothetical protein